MREEVTHLGCYGPLAALSAACLDFVATIHKSPLDLVARLGPRFDLNPEIEKLGFSS